MTPTCRFHCRECGGHFTSLAAFDSHREGPWDSKRRCSYPDDAGLVESVGVCRISSDVPLNAVTLYGAAAGVEVANYFRGREALSRELKQAA